MSNKYSSYLQEIPDTTWLIELISERFDNAINMMTPNSVIYGGAVRDCLAGKPLVGDLDIVVTSTDYDILTSRFAKNSKWVRTHKQPQIRELNKQHFTRSHFTKTHERKPLRGGPITARAYTTKFLDLSFEKGSAPTLQEEALLRGRATKFSGTCDECSHTDSVIKDPSLYGKYSRKTLHTHTNKSLLSSGKTSFYNKTLTQSTSFRTLYDRIVQIIYPNITLDRYHSSSFQTIVQFAKRVDIVCCGVILTNEGKTFEVVPGAYEDCKKNILRLNDISNITHIEQLQSRIKKLEERGWINNIDIDKVIREIKRKKQKEKSNPLAQNTIKESIMEGFNYITDSQSLQVLFKNPNDGSITVGVKYFLGRDTIRKIPKILNRLKEIVIENKLDVCVEQIKGNGIKLIALNKTTISFLCYSLGIPFPSPAPALDDCKMYSVKYKNPDPIGHGTVSKYKTVLERMTYQ